MTLDKFKKTLKSVDEFLEFDRVENKRSARRDLHALLLLDELLPGKGDLISAVSHDQFWIDIDARTLAKVVTPEQVLELNRCGLCYDEDEEGLYFLCS